MVNKKYRIKYNYDTGDSFQRFYGQEGHLELGWNSLNMAKENLKRIQEHYKMYQELENRWSRIKTNQEILSDYKEKDWFVKEVKPAILFNDGTYRCVDQITLSSVKKEIEDKGLMSGVIIDETMAQNCIILYTDDNKPFQFWAPWCGYFESLNFCEIETTENEMRFEVD